MYLLTVSTHLTAVPTVVTLNCLLLTVSTDLPLIYCTVLTLTSMSVRTYGPHSFTSSIRPRDTLWRDFLSFLFVVTFFLLISLYHISLLKSFVTALGRA